MASADPEVRTAAARKAAISRTYHLDAAGRRAMVDGALQGLARHYRQRAEAELGPDATEDQIQERMAGLRKLDAAAAALKSAQVRKERREAAELAALVEAGVTP